MRRSPQILAGLTLAAIAVACGQQTDLVQQPPLVLEAEGVPAEPEQPALEAAPPIPEVESAAAQPPAFPFAGGPDVAVADWRPPPYPVPWAILPGDHFYFGRPIPSGEVNWPNPQYRYGSTFFGEENVHTGVDLGAPRGTPVLAAAEGEVVWAGYGLYRGLPRKDDPYGLAIAIRHDFGHLGQALYTAYAHLSKSWAWVGQRVDLGQEIGVVGATGHATGDHLHFEVRLGQNRYFATRNPELWMVPPEGWGVLVGRILNTASLPLAEQQVDIESLETGQRWAVWSYANLTAMPDEAYGENLVISDLPAGPYAVRIKYVGRTFETQMVLLPGQVNVVEFRGRYGFVQPALPSAQSLPQPPG